MSIQLRPSRKGATFIRALLLKHNDIGIDSLPAAIVNTWGRAEAERIEKAAVAALTYSDIGGEAATEFLDAVVEQSIVGRLGLRRVPFMVRMLAMTQGASGYWVAEGAYKPVSKPSLTGSTLHPLKVAAIICATNESMRLGGGLVESGLQRDIERAVVLAMDQAFIDAANTGTVGEKPASVTAGATTINATGNARADLAALVDAFSGDLASAAFVTDPTTATHLALATDTAGTFLFPDLGPRGGSMLGMPVVVSRASPRGSNGGQLALLDASAIALGLEGVRIDSSTQATLAMSDDPNEEPELVSLYQINSTAMLAEVGANWEVQRSGAVAVLDGVL